MRSMSARWSLVSWLVLVAGALTAPVAAQEYPSRTIRVIAPFAAGGPSDIFARVYAAALGPRIGTTVVVENRTGAGGVVGVDVVAKSAKDGYTIVFAGPGALVAAPFMMDKFPYDVLRDLQPITIAATNPTAIIASNQSGYKSVRELIAHAKANPGKVSYASAGSGTLTHLSGELLKFSQGLDMVHIPYKGAVPALVDLRAGRVPAMMPDFPAALADHRAGNLVILAVASAKRSPAAPDIPTTEEAGLPDHVVESVYGLLAPAGIPPDVLKKLNTHSAAVLALPETIAAYRKIGAEATSSTPEQYRAWIESDQRRWSRVVKAGNLKLD